MANDTFVLDVVQAAELKYAFARNGWTNAEIKTLTGGDMLAKVRDVVRGLSTITPIQYAIDCDAPPYIPEGWSTHEEDQLPGRVKGIFTWDSTKVQLYRSKEQVGTKRIRGHELRKELASQPVLNANILDYLLKHPHLIPEEYKGTYVFFWGTIYRNSNGFLCVRFLCWSGDGWDWSDYWFGLGWHVGNPAAVASMPAEASAQAG